MPAAPILYRIQPSKVHAHLFEVRCTLRNPAAGGQRFALPAWIPGSYMIRDFARHIVSIRAESAGRPLRLEKIDKQTWQAAATRERRALSVTCQVYARDLSVRAAHLDQSHAFFNGASVFLRPLGQEHLPCLVDIQPPRGKAFANWRVATALAPATGEKGCAKPHGFGLYRAADYDELIDHPVEIGTFAHAAFSACGIRHEVAVSGRHDADLKRLTNDLQRLCEWQIRFFGEPAPMPAYVFLITAVDEAYGGLEHRASTALLCSRDDLPYPGMRGTPERYRAFLGLCSHEYFHTWNVKRIKPAAFCPYRLEAETYTTLLWAFEGFTSYYDDLTLLRCRLISRRQWLDGLARTIDKVQRAPGRHVQTLAEASFDAWTKHYRPDENTPNASVNYYAKGALVALALDLTLRAGSGGRVSLDDVMRTLWQRFGRDAGSPGIDDDDLQRIAEELSGIPLAGFFTAAVHGTDDLALAELLKPFAVRLTHSAASRTPQLGVHTAHAGDQVRLATVYSDGPAQVAGLSAGDLLVAIDGLRVTPDSFERLLSRRKAGQRVEVLAFRRDELLAFSVELAAPAADRHKLHLAQRGNALRRAWLGRAGRHECSTDCGSNEQ
ncbi:MAG: PDZ domain-containing protein [Candidatus Accumulibacter sp.]|uniref:M61 family metallopeptidase n=1 Tax=Accumulibacter sp. TaxID=2053492 RepID=UPI0028793CF4|nr:PDZ domain-containing protein [Accumulibacter sp.]MDS4013902.1 PDZ domain-containing protein [Accumulibacter sp.]